MTPAGPGIVIQARVGSTRLPGKVLEKVRGRTLLARLLDRLGRCRAATRIVVATPEGDADAPVRDEAARHGALVFAGSETDVLARYLGAARRHRIDPVVRITSDCPLHDPVVVDEAVSRFAALEAEGRRVDVVTNARPGARTYPRGLDVEVASLGALEDADSRLAPDAPDREHVTRYLYRQPALYRVDDLRLPLDLSFLRWTVDTAEDLEFVRAVCEELEPEDPRFGFLDVLALLGRRPELVAINAGVRQKET